MGLDHKMVYNPVDVFFALCISHCVWENRGELARQFSACRCKTFGISLHQGINYLSFPLV